MEIFEYIDRFWPVIVVLWVALSRLAAYLKRERQRREMVERQVYEAAPEQPEPSYGRIEPVEEEAPERPPSIYDLLGLPRDAALEAGDEEVWEEPAAEAPEEPTFAEEAPQAFAGAYETVAPEAAADEAGEWVDPTTLAPSHHWAARPVAAPAVEKPFVFDHSPAALRDAMIWQALIRPRARRRADWPGYRSRAV